MKGVFIFFAISALLPSLAHADQCEWISQTVAKTAYDLLATAKNYTRFCAPCLDDAPTTEPINTVDIRPVSDGSLYQISINSHPVDIAYIYIHGRNLGMWANCTPISDVPEYIDDFLTGRWHLDEAEF